MLYFIMISMLFACTMMTLMIKVILMTMLKSRQCWCWARGCHRLFDVDKYDGKSVSCENEDAVNTDMTAVFDGYDHVCPTMVMAMLFVIVTLWTLVTYLMTTIMVIAIAWLRMLLMMLPMYLLFAYGCMCAIVCTCVTWNACTLVERIADWEIDHA